MKPMITKDQFVGVLEAAGIDAPRQERFHREFERRHPAAHEGFLAWLGLEAGERARIRGQERAAN
jgi:hypothetical protein